MKKFFTPGPAELYPTLKKHLQQAVDENIMSISHRSEMFSNIFKNAVGKLKKLLNIPDEYKVLFLSSASEIMERIIENTVISKSYHFVNGSFSKRFFDIAESLKKDPIPNIVEEGNGFDFGQADIPSCTELICLTHNETSTGVALDMEDVYILHRNKPDILIALDVVSSAPTADIDFSKIDITFFSVQKGFGLPAGLGVLVISPRAYEKAELMFKENLNIGSYHNFLELSESEEKGQTPETPNVLGIYLFGKVVEDMRKVGIEKIRILEKQKAEYLYKYFEHSAEFELFVKNMNNRSETVITIEPKEDVSKLVKRLELHDMIIGKGYGKFKESQIRIANFPAHTLEDMKNLISKL